MDAAGPREFVDLFSSADWIVSDSFHALMFSLIFKSNIRIISPKTEARCQMFARIKEISAHMKGNLIVDDVASALESFSKGEGVAIDEDWLSKRRQESVAYLRRNSKL